MKMSVHYFEDEEGYIWSCTYQQMLDDVKDYEKYSGEVVKDPLQFTLDNIDESGIKFKLHYAPPQPKGPQYRKPTYLGDEI